MMETKRRPARYVPAQVFLPVGGIDIRPNKNFPALVAHDGSNVRPIPNYTYNRRALSLIMVKSEYPGVSYSVAF
ncbi:MAG: hypothetical protein LC803_08600 [Acidobacteria bacterium]|nr:hypothetical protein [Acidobacteriota bacterium]